MKEIDARGLACPEPVVLVQKGIQSNPDGVVVTVNAMVSVENIKRFAAARGYTVTVCEQSGDYVLTLQK